MKTFVVLRRSVYRAAVAVLPAPVMLTVLVARYFSSRNLSADFGRRNPFL